MRITRLLVAAFTLLAIAPSHAQSTASDELVVERLTWAGIKLVSGDTTVFIDAVGNDIWDGNAPGGLIPVEAETGRRYALITHTHGDHFDPATLKKVLGERGYVICHESIATHVASRGLQVIPATMFTPVFRGGFAFTPVPAEDGFGAPQVSWIVSRGSSQFLHAGDTLWHGQWDTIGRQYGPFDLAFLPINGARIDSDPMPETPGVMTPAQAADAALLLRAKVLVPIHFGFNDPPDYIEVDDPLGALTEIARRRNIDVINMAPGDTRNFR